MHDWIVVHYTVLKDFAGPTVSLMGFLATVIIAGIGLNSFGRWRREQLEGKRIELAIEALTIAYKTKFVFGNIRSPMTSSAEWVDMPKLPDDTDDKRSRRGAFYAAFKRIEQNKDFFEGLWELQPKFMVIFGPQTESTFLKAHQARRNIEVAAQMLFQNALEEHRERHDESTQKLYSQLRGHLWAGMGQLTDKGDEVGKLLDEFKDEIEAICLPLLREFGKTAPK